MSHLHGLKFLRRRKRMTGWVGAFSIRNAYRILVDKVKGSHHLRGLNPVMEITIHFEGLIEYPRLKWLRLWR
jgi:hypothetical protein